MKELLALIKSAATMAGLAAIRAMKAADFELMVECGTSDMPINEANELRGKLARIADTIGGQSSGLDGSSWKNVAFNLDPTQGSSTRVGRSYGRG
jgi:hypothetical protein|tara:strand:- start:188 stop:472 length:285 start_codon:yes stop_codon:yes gene_type:complete